MSDTNSAKIVAPSPTELDTARRLWALIVQKIGEVKITLAAALNNSRALPVGRDGLQILFQKEFDCEIAKRNTQLIADCAAEVAGRKIIIELKAPVYRVVSGPPEVDSPSRSEIPEHLIPISEVYETAQRNWHLQKRAIQWYATEGFIPKPKHVGREAYYDKRTIYSYFTIIHLLSRGHFGFSLSEIRTLIRQLDKLKTIVTPNGKLRALAAAEAFIRDHAQYEAQIWDIYGVQSPHDGERSLSMTLSARITSVRNFIKDGLRGQPQEIRALLGMTMLDIEAEVLDRARLEKEMPF